MPDWVLRGLRSGVRSSAYPKARESAAGVSPGRPQGAVLASPEKAQALAERCPTGAIQSVGRAIDIDQGRCVHCSRCRPDAPDMGAPWSDDYEWGALASGRDPASQRLARAFGRSLHIRFVDAGACGACMSEARQLANPYYNLHRLGFFMTPTPRNADVLMVAGPVSDAMRIPLLKTYEAMPTPKRVVALGACGISGGVFGPSFAASGGVADVIPVDVDVPGCPPPPLAILHALLVLVERKPPSKLESRAPEQERSP
jgi:Ni,Fe-hydrogenase III small subunit